MSNIKKHPERMNTGMNDISWETRREREYEQLFKRAEQKVWSTWKRLCLLGGLLPLICCGSLGDEGIMKYNPTIGGETFLAYGYVRSCRLNLSDATKNLENKINEYRKLQEKQVLQLLAVTSRLPWSRKRNLLVAPRHSKGVFQNTNVQTW